MNTLDFCSFPWISVLLVCVTAVILVLRYLGRNDDYWKKRGVPYFPRESLFHVIRMMATKAITDRVSEYYKKFGRIHGAFEFSTPMLIIHEPELLKNILVKDFHIFNYRRDMKMGIPIFDKMVSVLKGDDWKRVRTIITPAFTSKRMRQMSSIINDSSKTVLETFDKHYQNGQPVDCRGVFGAFTMDVIASAAFGTKIDSHNDANNVFVKHAKDVFKIFSVFSMFINLIIPISLLKRLGVQTYKTMDFFRDVTLQVIKERKAKGQRYNDVLQMLMDATDEELQTDVVAEDEEDHFGSIIANGMQGQSSLKYKSISEDELLSQCVLFFFVGYETTGTTLSYIAYNLALNPTWQEKLVKEVDESFRTHGVMSYDAVRDMKILDAVISETLRMYPPLAVGERTATEDYELGNGTGIIVEKGMRIAFFPYAMHNDPEYFENPETFDPNRFLQVPPKHPQYAYLPFGAGPRNCLGMRFALLEIKLCIANLLRQYTFKRHDSTQVPLKFKKGVGFLMVDTLPLTIEKRKDIT